MAYPTKYQFTPLKNGVQNIVDFVNDESPSAVDLVGSQSNPAFFYAYDGLNVYFRMRLNGDPRNSQKTGFRNYSWGVLINTEGDPATYEWMLAVNGLNNRLDLIRNTVKIPHSWNDPAEGTDGKGGPSYSRPIINFDRARVVVADSELGGNSDYFLDFFIEAEVFFSILGITENTPISLIVFTSTNANNYNKDSLRKNEGFAFAEAFTNPVAIAEGDIRARLDVSTQLVSGPSKQISGQIGTFSLKVTVRNTGQCGANIVLVKLGTGLSDISEFSLIAASRGVPIFNRETSSGSWTIGNLEAGASAVLSFAVTGRFRRAGDQMLLRSEATGFDLYSGKAIGPVVSVLNITVAATGGIAGTAVNQLTGLPVAGVPVLLLQNGSAIASATTDARGLFSFVGITAGTYVVSINQPTYQPFSQALTIVSGQTLELTAGLQPKSGLIQGVVTAEGGAGISAGEVKLLNSLGIVVAITTTDAEGRYRLDNIPPGFYTISISMEGYQAATSGVIVNPDESSTQHHTLIRNPGTIRGAVTSPGGPVISGAVIDVLNLAGLPILSTTTNVDGAYELERLEPGDYRLRVTAQDYAVETIGFTVVAGEVVSIPVVLTPSPGSVTGTVVDRLTGAIVANPAIRILDENGFVVAETVGDQAGQYVVPSLAPGVYVVIAMAEGYGLATTSVVIRPNQSSNLPISMRRKAGSIRGTVKNVSGATLVGAVVRFFQNNRLVLSILSDETGSYRVDNLGPGNYSVVTSFANYGTETDGAIILDEEVSNVQTMLRPDSGTIAGVVRSDTGVALSGAAIVIKDQLTGMIVYRTLTDMEGRFDAAGIAPGHYMVSASFANHQTVVSGAEVLSNQQAALSFELQPNPVTVTGLILNQQTGSPIVGANVEVRLMNWSGLTIKHTFTDEAGRYTVQQLSPGTYTVVASSDQFQVNGGTVTIGAGETGTVDLSLSPVSGALAGILINARTGEKLTGAAVQIADRNQIIVKTTITDTSGAFLATGLAPGNYTITGKAQGFQSKAIGANVVADFTSVTSLSLDETPAVVTGVVVPAGSGTVSIFTMDNILVASIVTDMDGRFAYRNLAPGDYVLVAARENYQTERVGLSLLAGESRTVGMDLKANPATISGTVLSTQGLPLADAVITIFDLAEVPIGSALTDMEGNFSIVGLPPGAYQVVAKASNFSNQTTGVVLGPGEIRTGIGIELSPESGVISGQLQDRNGTIIPGGTVVIRNAFGGMVASITSSLFGNFIMSGLAPGHYTVTANATGFASEVRGAIVVSNEETVTHFSLSANPGLLQGIITDQAGNRIAGNGLLISVYDPSGVLAHATVADQSGFFRIQELPPGQYLLQISAPVYATETMAIEIRSDLTTDVTMTLSLLKSTLAGRVVTRTGTSAIPGAIVTVMSPEGVFISRSISGLDGEFILSNLQPGVVTASVFAPGFGIATATIYLSAGEASSVDLILTPTPGTLVGFVTDLSTSLPIVGGLIAILDDKGAILGSIVSDSFGRYQSLNLAPGRYRVRSTSFGYTTMEGAAEIQSDQTSLLSFALSSLPGEIYGVVRNERTGQGIPGVTVLARFLSAAGPAIAVTVTDDAGSYRLPNLSEGMYTIVATGDQFGSAAGTVEVKRETIHLLDLMMEESPGAVEGNVFASPSGEPVSGAYLRLYDEFGVLIRTVEADADGFYKITGFQAGVNRLVVVHSGYQRQEMSFTVGFGETAAVSFHLAANPGTIRGDVVDSEMGIPLVGADVLLFDATSSVSLGRTVTDGLGQYRFEGLSPGVYTVSATFVNYARASVGSVVNSDEETVTDLRLVGNPASISGRITTTGGTPLKDAVIKAIRTNGTVAGTAAADMDGYYTIGNMSQGDGCGDNLGLW